MQVCIPLLGLSRSSPEAFPVLHPCAAPAPDGSGYPTHWVRRSSKRIRGGCSNALAHQCNNDSLAARYHITQRSSHLAA